MNQPQQMPALTLEAADPVLYAVILRWESALADFLDLSNGGEGLLNRAKAAEAWSRVAITTKGSLTGFQVITDDGLRIEYSKAHFIDVFSKIFGNLMTPLFATKLKEKLDATKGKQAKIDLQKEAAQIGLPLLIKEMLVHRNASAIEEAVDMFCVAGSLQVKNGVMRSVLPFKPLPVGEIDPQVVADYKEHFPGFDDFLCAILYSRFAYDRRDAYCWLHAPSDWGKGFVFKLFADLGIATALTVEQIGKIMAGDNVGVPHTEFVNSWMITVDEWRWASRELKQLNNEAYVTAKYALRVRVPLFYKLFASKEEVESLTGEGVDSQQNNRFAYLEFTGGSLITRPVYMKVGKQRYTESMISYVAQCLNGGVLALRKLGKEEATKQADAYLRDYRLRHLLSETFGDLDDGLTNIAAEISRMLKTYGNWLINPANRNSGAGYFARDHGIDNATSRLLANSTSLAWFRAPNGNSERGLLVKNPDALVKAYLKQPGSDKRLATKLSYRAKDIAALLDEKLSRIDSKGQIYNYGAGAEPNQRGHRDRGITVSLTFAQDADN